MLSGTNYDPVPIATALIHNISCANSNINFFTSNNMVPAPSTSSCTNNSNTSAHPITADTNKNTPALLRKGLLHQKQSTPPPNTKAVLN
jgi:hypothetical protein